MANQFIKLRPLRSREFMSFAHDTSPSPCCLCGEKPFDQLHHFGSGGGMGMKPSDYLVARLCRECHQKYDMKELTLLKNGHVDVLMSMQRDALDLHDMWLRKLEETRGQKLMLRCRTCYYCDGKDCCASLKHVEPPSECALDDLLEKLLSMSSDNAEEDRRWFVEWSNRRSANVLSFCLESMQEILSCSEAMDMKFIASQALKVAGVKGE